MPEANVDEESHPLIQMEYVLARGEKKIKISMCPTITTLALLLASALLVCSLYRENASALPRSTSLGVVNSNYP